MEKERLNDLILQSLEHEMGGVLVYENALKCVINEDLEKEWQKYLQQTRTHVEILRRVCDAFGLDPDKQIPSRAIVRTVGGALVTAMQIALKTGDRGAAQVVACEAVVLAETKDHLDWELLSKCAEKLSGAQKTALTDACEQVEDEEDEHLYHTKGWCRELWFEALGLPPVLPPPEERKHVTTAIGAARAEQAAEKTRERSKAKR